MQKISQPMPFLIFQIYRNVGDGSAIKNKKVKKFICTFIKSKKDISEMAYTMPITKTERKKPAAINALIFEKNKLIKSSCSYSLLMNN
jgi:hypothetical protein